MQSSGILPKTNGIPDLLLHYLPFRYDGCEEAKGHEWVLSTSPESANWGGKQPHDHR